MRVKICGLTRADDVRVAADAGASYLGFVFFPPSPRSISPDQARDLLAHAPAAIGRVALLVDPDDALVAEVAALPITMLQLHGQESAERVAELRERSGLPVMKAIGIRDAADVAKIDHYAPVVDQLLIDTKPPKGATRPGGNAVTFDWNLIAGRQWSVPWMLAGGLNAGNVLDAARVTGAEQVDVSSAVESAPGIKDPDLVRTFIAAATA
ncbi:phosphoribosylanthranilate isomerase [Rhodobacteraceae bacterium NNCM2]|nr:phosphoribosylanthranilate isomerase [Coraliihabitans acroporae]